MSQTIITLAFEQYKAQQEAIAAPVELNEFVLANVPNQDASLPIDRNEGLPPQTQIVLVGDVSQAGYVNPNAVVYSLLMDTTIGDFDFNWIGLRNKVSGIIAAISHIPTVHKLKTVLGVQNGNSVTRSIMMSYSDAKGLTNIDVDASTWQIDFTARLFGIDEAERLGNLDVFGKAAFLSDGFKVEKLGSNYIAKAGRGYVGGLRCNLAADLVLKNVTNSVGIYLDASWQGQLTSEWQTLFEIKVSNTALIDYVDGGGYQHYVTKIVDVDAAGNVIDGRYIEGFAEYYQQASVDGLLDKKIDKASITDRVASTSSILVASAKGLKSAYDKAVSAYNLAASKMTQTIADGRYLRTHYLSGCVSRDANEVNTSGVSVHYLSSSAENKPPGYDHALFSMCFSNIWGASIAADWRTNKWFVRVNSGGTWKVWDQLITKSVGDSFYLGKAAKAVDSGELNGKTNTTAATVSSIVERDSAGDIQARLIRTDYADQTSAPISTAAIMFRNNDSSDNYIRSMTKAAMKEWLTLEKADIGLSNVNNWRATSAVDDSSPSKYATAKAVKTAHDKATSAFDLALLSAPAGVPLPWPQATAPAGFLECRGQSFNKDSYPELAKAYPSGVLSDMRGEFIRGLDSGRGVDNGRGVLSYQPGTKIAGEVGISSSANSHTIHNINNVHGDPIYETNFDMKIQYSGSNHPISTSASYWATTRPRNRAYMYIVRAA